MRPRASAQVLVFSFGGTKFQVGALFRDGSYHGGPEIAWRTDPRFRPALSADAKTLTRAVGKALDDFLVSNAIDWAQLDCVGFPFPGPCRQELWYSNNLTPAFRDGVPLQALLSEALGLSRARPGSVVVMFDAQADAGGELYHPKGQLVGFTGHGLVLNLATGVAAGLVRDGRVLIGDALRSTNGFDSAAGQVGRHLWFDPESRRWSYHYLPGGGTPRNVPGQRMTDRLSGPALAARLASRIAATELETMLGPGWLAGHVSRYLSLPPHTLLDRLRRDSETTRALLVWADSVASDPDHPAAQMVYEFAIEIANDLAGALRAWMVEPAWNPFGQRIVLTGGVGIRFLASTDDRDSFLARLVAQLPESIISRSTLLDATERESYIFAYQ